MSTNFQLTNSNVKKKSKIVNYALNLKDIYRNEVKPSRQKYFDKLIELYIDRKLENKRTLQNAIDGLRYDNKKLAKNTINKYKDSFTKAGIIKGTKIEKTYQINVGGNTDFLNMKEQDRLASKRISKTESVQSQLAERLAGHGRVGQQAGNRCQGRYF
jgi:hypothetical protein